MISMANDFHHIFFLMDEQNKEAQTDINNQSDKEACAMHSMKLNEGGSKSKRWWQWSGSQMRRVFQTHRGQGGSRGFGEVPGQQQRWL